MKGTLKPKTQKPTVDIIVRTPANKNSRNTYELLTQLGSERLLVPVLERHVLQQTTRPISPHVLVPDTHALPPTSEQAIIRLSIHVVDGVLDVDAARLHLELTSSRAGGTDEHRHSR